VGKFGVTDASSELYLMEQLYDYKMVENRSVVEQAHEIQALAKELEPFPCPLPDKFVAGGIITKLPPSWKDFGTSLKHKRREFNVEELIVLLMLKRGLELRTMEKVLRPGLPMWCRRETSTSSTRRKTRERKRKFLSQFRLHSSRKRTIIRREVVLCVAVRIIGQVSALIVSFSKKRSQQMLVLLIHLVEHLGMVIPYHLFFQFVIHLSGGWTVVLIFMCVLMFLCFLHTRSGSLAPIDGKWVACTCS